MKDNAVPIEMNWANEKKTVIHYRSTGEWTWDEYVVADDQLRAMLDSVDHPVVILYDTRGLKIPADIFSHYHQLRNEVGLEHPNSAVSVVVVSNRLWVNIIQSFMRLYKTDQPRHFFVRTREEAEEIAATQAKLLQASAS